MKVSELFGRQSSRRNDRLRQRFRSRLLWFEPLEGRALLSATAVPATDINPLLSRTDLTVAKTASQTYTSTTTGAVSGNTVSGTGAIKDVVDMAVGSTISYVVSATVATTATGTLVNFDALDASSADVTGPELDAYLAQFRITIGEAVRDPAGSDTPTNMRVVDQDNNARYNAVSPENWIRIGRNRLSASPFGLGGCTGSGILGVVAG